MKVRANGAELHYEVFGTGRPILLLHGNSENYKIFDRLIEELQRNFQVYALDSRCHGESEKTKEISYDLMAADTIGFIQTLGIEKPILYGFSDGGIIGLLVAIREPALLSRLIISGANLDPTGTADSLRWIARLVYFFTRNKLFKMMLTEPNIPVEELHKITIPTHVLAGEKDLIKEKHTRLIAENIPGSTLEIIPGERHGSYIVHSEKIYEILKKYILEG